MSHLTGQEGVARACRARGNFLDPRLRGDDKLWVAHSPHVIPAQAGIQQPTHFAIPTATIQPFKFTETGYWLNGYIPLGTEDAGLMGRLDNESAALQMLAIPNGIAALCASHPHSPNDP